MRITIDVDESTGQSSVSGISQTVAAAAQGGGFDGGAAFVSNGLGVIGMSVASRQNGGSAPDLVGASVAAVAQERNSADMDGGKAANHKKG